MNYRHPWQLKKSKSWEPFSSYQLNSTADLANLAQFWGKMPIVHFMWNSLLLKCPHFLGILFQSCHGGWWLGGHGLSSTYMIFLRLLALEYISQKLFLGYTSKPSQFIVFSELFWLILDLYSERSPQCSKRGAPPLHHLLSLYNPWK